MGFEPMRVSTLELESNALDRSATIAGKITTLKNKNNMGYIILIILMD